MPAWVAKPLAHVLIEMGTPVQWDETRLVYILVEDRHESRPLHNLIAIAVVRRNTRQRITYDTPRTYIEVLWSIIGAWRVFQAFVPPDLSLLAIRCEGRLSAVRRVINERRAAIR